VRFLCPRRRAAVWLFATAHRSGEWPDGPRSIPSMSGGCFRPSLTTAEPGSWCFYALDVGTAVCDVQRASSLPRRTGRTFLTSRCRAAVLRHGNVMGHGVANMFLCPRRRATVCDHGWFHAVAADIEFLCPRRRAAVCDLQVQDQGMSMPERFLCPRCRAVVCDRRRHARRRHADGSVSMPSMSGGCLRPMPSGGGCDLRVWCPFRHPPVTGGRTTSDPWPAAARQPLTRQFPVRQPTRPGPILTGPSGQWVRRPIAAIPRCPPLRSRLCCCLAGGVLNQLSIARWPDRLLCANARGEGLPDR
jgi:hypothetical protein